MQEQLSIQPLIDLLLYHRQGDNNFFNKLVEQWLSLSRPRNRLIYNKKNAYAIRSNLAALGFIEPYQSSEVQRWTSLGPSAIKVPEKGRILYLHQYQLDQFPRNSIQRHNLFSLREGSLLIHLTAPQTLGMSKIHGMACIKPNFESLINLLPPISEAINDQKVCNRLSELSHDLNLESHDFENNSWHEAEDFTGKGLYRQKPDYGPYRYFIVDKYHDGQIFEVLDKAWIFALAHERLNYPITIKYDQLTKEGRIVPRHFFRLPPILQRILISDSLVFPEYEQGYLVLKNLESKRLHKLIDKMGSLKVSD